MSDHTPNAEAVGIIEKLWAIYYSEIAGSDNLKIAHYESPVYDSAQRLIKSLFRVAYPLIPAEYAYELCVGAGELLSESVLTKAWIDHCNSDY